ncbi:MAG: shikimate dehydrogenase [Planctomycetota bacterium]|jgi:shikimate dehydrogenase
MNSNSKNIYGLIGKELKHSFSPAYFKNKFQKEGITNSDYQLFPLKSIDDFPALLKEHKNLKGLNVTIPYKQAIIPFLDEIDAAAKGINAVNTIRFVGDKLIGYNTDVLGFEKSLLPFLKKKHKKALIFGTGGASNAVAFVLKKLNISFKLVSRSKTKLSYADINEKRLKKYRLLINTTPLGTFPNIEECVAIDYKGFSKKHLAYDLVYNPLESTFLRKAKELGAKTKNGLEMLNIQAEEAWKIWNE